MTRPTATNRVTRRYLAAIDRASGLATPWNPNDSGRVLLHTASPVSAIAIEDGFLYFASATTGEVQRADLVTAEVDQDWRLVVNRTGGLPGSVVAMVVRAGVLYLGGDFDTIRARRSRRRRGGRWQRWAWTGYCAAGPRPLTAPRAPRWSAGCCRWD